MINTHTVRLKSVVGQVWGMGALAAVAVSALVSAKPASALPASLTQYPSTDIYSPGVFNYSAVTYLDKTVRNGTVAATSGLDYGTGDNSDKAFGRSEFGFDYLTSIAGSPNFGERFLLNAKTQLSNSKTTRVVAGFWGLGSKQVLAPNVAYLLAAKSFSFGRVHIGVAQSLQKKDIVGNQRTNLQLGYDRLFANGKLQFTADYYTGKTSYSAFAPGLIYYINDKASAQIGYVIPNDRSRFGPNQFLLGFYYNFGRGLSESAPAPETAPPASPAAPPVTATTPAG